MDQAQSQLAYLQIAVKGRLVYGVSVLAQTNCLSAKSTNLYHHAPMIVTLDPVAMSQAAAIHHPLEDLAHSVTDHVQPLMMKWLNVSSTRLQVVMSASLIVTQWKHGNSFIKRWRLDLANGKITLLRSTLFATT